MLFQVGTVHATNNNAWIFYDTKKREEKKREERVVKKREYVHPQSL